MAGGYFNGFQLVKFDADGDRILMDNEMIDVHNAVTSAFIDTVSSDDFGNVPDGIIDEAAGELVEFSISGYPEVFQRRLAGSHEVAHALEENAELTYVAENLYTETEEAIMAEVWVEKMGDPDAVDQMIGYGRAGATAKFPFPNFQDGLYRVYLQPITKSGRRGFTRYKQSPVQMVAATSASGIPAIVEPNLVFAGPTEEPEATPTFRRLRYVDLPPLRRGLFDITADAFSSGIGTETIWSYTMPANTLANDGDKLEYQFAVLTPNGGATSFGIKFNGTYLIWTRNYNDPSLVATFIVRGWIIRDEFNSIRAGASIQGGDTSGKYYLWSEEIASGSDLTADSLMEFECDGLSLGDLSIRSGYGEYVPLANPDFEAPSVGALTGTPVDESSILWQLEEGTDPLL